jgi:ribose 5-phosphate isomerase A
MKIEEHALQLIQDSAAVGLGSGRAATAFIHALGKRVQQGFKVRGVPTSENSAQLARQLGIPLVSFDNVEYLDVDVDGADEVDPHNNLIKGLGGALVREKIVAAAARRLVILVGPEKIVPVLGSRGVLPVEVIPFALGPCRRRLEQLGIPGKLRMVNGQTFVSDNGNYILDCQIGPMPDPAHMNITIRAIPGVVDHGMFLAMKPTVLVQDGDKVQVRE